MPDYRIQRIGAASFNELIPLMRNCFGMEVNIAYFEWKYLHNPAGQFIGFIAVEESTGAIGAYYGVIPQLLLVEGKSRIIYQSCDTMTHSDHRRRGLFQMLAKECFRYLKEQHALFVIGYGGANSTPGFIKFGWKHGFDFRYYFKPSLLCRFSGTRKLSEKGFKETKNLDFLDNWSLPDKKVIHSPRSASHGTWRMNNPLHQYHCVTYGNNSAVDGYVIYYISANKLVLFDFGWKQQPAAKALLSMLNGLVIKNKYKGIVSFCQENGWQAHTLRQEGFWANPFKKGPLHEKTPFIFYTDDDGMRAFSDPAAWQMTGYDHDAY